MTEPDTTLTDIALAGLCVGFALALPTAGVAGLYGGLFAALGLASAFGALWHGWWAGARAGIGGGLWLAVMLAVGVANLFLWLIAARLAALGGLAWIGWAQLALYALFALFVTRSFLLPSGFSLPPTLVLLGLYLARLDQPGFVAGAAALTLALIGAGLQAARIGLPALRLGHNALYHVVQAAAFTLLFLARPGA